MLERRGVEVQIRQVRQIHGDLSRLFQQGQWGALAGSLETLSKVAEGAGHQNLCLKAQSLGELIGYRGGGRADLAGERLSQLMQELLAQVSHWCWTLDERAGSSSSQLSH
ncbi:MAG: hypothetical protein ACK5QT_05815 [Oligoflexia bacterium]|jgi:hypothetical protein